jgi:hypothetical protein
VKKGEEGEKTEERRRKKSLGYLALKMAECCAQDQAILFMLLGLSSI